MTNTRSLIDLTDAELAVIVNDISDVAHARRRFIVVWLRADDLHADGDVFPACAVIHTSHHTLTTAARAAGLAQREYDRAVANGSAPDGVRVVVVDQRDL